jgi:hypothetical protein
MSQGPERAGESVPRYWLDASVLIEAHLRTYPIGIANSFWVWLDGGIQQGDIVCPRRVYREVAESEHQDELAQWMRHRKSKGLCVAPSRHVQTRVKEVEEYVFLKYKSVEAWEFSKGADPWVIAHALEDRGIVVTKESFTRPDAQKVRIPDVCDNFNVKCVDTLQMLKDLKAKF